MVLSINGAPTEIRTLSKTATGVVVDMMVVDMMVVDRTETDIRGSLSVRFVKGPFIK